MRESQGMTVICAARSHIKRADIISSRRLSIVKPTTTVSAYQGNPNAETYHRYNYGVGRHFVDIIEKVMLDCIWTHKLHTFCTIYQYNLYKTPKMHFSTGQHVSINYRYTILFESYTNTIYTWYRKHRSVLHVIYLRDLFGVTKNFDSFCLI